MFKRKHYIPILKSRQGEQWALASLKTQSRSRLTPLIELHKHKSKSVNDHANEMCEALANGWGTSRPFFLDTVYFGVEGASAASSVTTIFNAARSCGLNAIPVIGPERSQSYRSRVRQVAEQDGRGVMIRARHDDVNANIATTINAVVGDLGLSHDSIDMLLDYRSADLNLTVDIPRIPNIADWRTFTVASGSFPRSIGNYQQGTWHLQPREEWTQWLAQSGLPGIVRLPTFGDYATRDPGPPAGGGKPNVAVRYTSNNDWLVRVGGRVADGAAPQMVAICDDLVHRPEFSGPTFSAGDEAIANCATGNHGTGNVGQWTAWALSHHLEYAAHQVATGSAP